MPTRTAFLAWVTLFSCGLVVVKGDCTPILSYVTGAECTGDDCLSTASCPPGTHLIRCEAQTQDGDGGDGAFFSARGNVPPCVPRLDLQLIAQ